jgi:hypothetical protein
MRDAAMLLPSNAQDHIDDQLRHAHQVTETLIAAVIEAACRRFPSAGQSERTARIERLIAAEAWTDAAFALIELELPQWQVRRIAYDQGEWHCALSRERELPEWLDQSLEARHPDLPLAILRAFIEAQRDSAPSVRPSVPIVRREAAADYEALCPDNFA